MAYTSFAVAVILVFIEGAASLATVAHRLYLNRKPVAERLHTEYDELLGWVNLPSIYIEDMYGPGVSLSTDKLRFRGSQELTREVPPGKVRVICSGDSFTLGYGVDDDHTWCHLLTSLDTTLQTVNMGQGGYGIDQAYLWYARDGIQLEHDVQIFAFIDAGFERMRRDEFIGYAKPYLRLAGAALITENTPVPPYSSYKVWLNRNAPIIGGAHSLRLIRRLLPGRDPTDAGVIYDADETNEIASSVFRELDRLNRAEGSVLVLVYLPTLGNYRENTAERRRAFLATEAARYGLIFLDLTQQLDTLPAETVESFFIPEDGIEEFVAAAGHYTAGGNAHVARLLYEGLLSIPEIAEQLGQK